MEWHDVDTTYCGVAASVDAVGDRWSLLILRDIFAGVGRFDDLHRHIGVSTAVLSDRLRGLCGNGLLERATYREEGQRSRSEYRLTERGRDLLFVQVALAEFGHDHLIDPERRLVHFVDAQSGQRLRLSLVDEDGKPVGSDQVRMQIRSVN